MRSVLPAQRSHRLHRCPPCNAPLRSQIAQTIFTAALYAGSPQTLLYVGSQFILRTCRTVLKQTALFKIAFEVFQLAEFPVRGFHLPAGCLFPAFNASTRLWFFALKVVKLLLQLLRDLISTSLISTAIVFLLIRSSDFSVHSVQGHIILRAGTVRRQPRQTRCFGTGFGEVRHAQDSFDFCSGFPRGRCVLDVADPRLVVRRERPDYDFKGRFLSAEELLCSVVFPVFQDVRNRRPVNERRFVLFLCALVLGSSSNERHLT